MVRKQVGEMKITRKLVLVEYSRIFIYFIKIKIRDDLVFFNYKIKIRWIFLKKCC